LYELADAYLYQGQIEEAEDLFTRGIQIGHRKWPGVNHPYALETENDLAMLY